MSKGATIEISPVKPATNGHPGERFQERFGHPFNRQGFHGHSLYGYNCRDCGLHISLVRPRRWLEAERKGNFPGLALPEFAGFKAGTPH